MSPAMLTLVAAVLAYERIDRVSEICERRSGRSGRSALRYAMSDTSEEKDMVDCCRRGPAAGWQTEDGGKSW